jgi:hypothetical protein
VDKPADPGIYRRLEDSPGACHGDFIHATRSTPQQSSRMEDNLYTIHRLIQRSWLGYITQDVFDIQSFQ